MNDFTKEELLMILDDVSSSINRSGGRDTDFYKSLRDKIQSLIDNYCEHDESIEIIDQQSEEPKTIE